MNIAQNHTVAAPPLSFCRRFADAPAGPDGVADVPLPGVSVVRAVQEGKLQVAVQKPVIAMLLQGRKRVTTAHSGFEYSTGAAMVVSADIPTVSQITRASPAHPYYALVLELSPEILRELSALVPDRSVSACPVRVEPLAPEVMDAATRLARLFDQPKTLATLGEGIVKELHYWLLMGPHGPAIRAIGTLNSHAERIGRAVAILRRDFARPIRVSELADAAGMSEAAFHRQFRAITTLGPLQFQKQLRPIESRRLLLTEGKRVAQASQGVGYARIPQFTREYGRFFGVTPAQDARTSCPDTNWEGGVILDAPDT
ncbi:MAG: AraC family transcriptional regulator N-terminal domain-containing protein [Roseovarius sp.]